MRCVFAKRDDDYGRAATYYDRVFEPLMTGLWSIGQDLCPLKPGAIVLDVGCGTGALLERYQRAGCAIQGVEPSLAMFRKARRRLGAHVPLHRALGDALPLPNGSVDLVTLSQVVHELDEPVRRRVLAEAARVLKPTGRIVVVEFHPGPDQFPSGHLWRMLHNVFEFLAGTKHYQNYRDFMRRGGLPVLARQSGLVIEREKVVGKGTMGVYVLTLP